VVVDGGEVIRSGVVLQQLPSRVCFHGHRTCTEHVDLTCLITNTVRTPLYTLPHHPPQIPLAPYSDALTRALAAELPCRAHVSGSPAHLGAVHAAFFSAVNTGGGATCMGFSADARMVSGEGGGGW
jgi:hypothetical protein